MVMAAEPMTMLSPVEALDAVAAACERLAPRRVALEEACGLVLAEPVAADRDCPPFPRAMMDGYAVRLSAAGTRVRVVGEAVAGRRVEAAVGDGQAWEIMTGAACPPGTEAVVPKEHATREGDRAAMPARIAPGQHIAAPGSECRAGEIVLEPGDVITPLAVGAMASFGLERVDVVPRPVLGIVVSGTELAPPGTPPAAAQIRDANGPMLAALARTLGLERPRLVYAPDALDSLGPALRAMAECDLVVLSGGVSVGKYDLVPEALGRYGAEVNFHRVRQKPGKPLLLARRGRQVLFGLPGNPLACHFCFHRYVAAAVRALSGRSSRPAVLEGVLAEAVAARPGRTHFVPGRTEPGPAGQPWTVRPLPGVSSADVFHSHRANCYVEVPPRPGEIPPGERVALSLLEPC
jgi:molybdopterin molybdotransferase